MEDGATRREVMKTAAAAIALTAVSGADKAVAMTGDMAGLPLANNALR